MTKAINLKHEALPGEAYVYVGRPSKWGNPFVIGKDGTREEVVQKYKEWLCWQPELYDAIFTELEGRLLGCFCAPLPCHGDVLARIADGNLVLLPYSREEFDAKDNS